MNQPAMNPAKDFHFRLYVAGNGPNSTRALDNLTALCREHLNDGHRIEIVDVTREPERALKDKVLLTPTLIKVAPAPARKIIGNLNDTATVLLSLGVHHPA
jgi:circadian clock protein KaiB